MTVFRRPCLVLSLCAGAFALVIAGNAAAQQSSQVVSELTRAERTQFQETSSCADVMSFVETVVAASPNIHVTTFGYSFEARPLPLVVVGDVADASPEAVVRAERCLSICRATSTLVKSAAKRRC